LCGTLLVSPAAAGAKAAALLCALIAALSCTAAAELHGDMTQAARLESLEKFRRGEVAFLLATDVAARGLDILGVQARPSCATACSLTVLLHVLYGVRRLRPWSHAPVARYKGNTTTS
jgi:hypothetical protein